MLRRLCQTTAAIEPNSRAAEPSGVGVVVGVGVGVDSDSDSDSGMSIRRHQCFPPM